MTLSRRLLLGSAAALAAPATLRAQAPIAVDFLFPVAVGGPITRIIDGYAQDFEREHPGITVRPVYAGSYVDTLTKAQTALKAGGGPAMAVLLSTDAYTLIDDGSHRAVRHAARRRRLAGCVLPGVPAATRRSAATIGACRSSAPPS